MEPSSWDSSNMACLPLLLIGTVDVDTSGMGASACRAAGLKKLPITLTPRGWRLN